MKKIVFSMALAALIGVLVPAFAATTPTLNKFQHRASEQPAGFYDVLVLKGGQWQHAGILRYGSHFRDQQIDISPFLPTDGKINVRLFQNGGGAAHIDTVLLGGQSPSEVNGCIDPLALKKLLKKDHDVIDAYYKTLDLSFDSTGVDKSLVLNARIEPYNISKTPFQFPQHNLFRSITAGSQFYPYQLKSKNGSLGGKTTKLSGKSFFKEYCLTGSGHPSGFTYGWVSNDEKHLYVKLDFTPDNTLDGNKDYAKVYVRQGQDLKEYKVSEIQNRWGNTEFTYTDKAAYQHKVYNFAIPFESLDIKQPAGGEKIDLAFAAYGTASPANGPVDTAYDEEYRRYLIVYVNSGNYVAGQIVDENGSLLGGEFNISANPDSYHTSIVHNPNNTNFLVLFERTNAATGIYGQIVSPDYLNPLAGTNFPISEVSAQDPANARGAYDYYNDQFLVVWEDDRSGFDDLYGRVITNVGGPVTGDFPVMTSGFRHWDPAVAFDGWSEKYIVVWADNRSHVYGDIYARLIDVDGDLNGSEFVVSPDPLSQWAQTDPAIAYDPANRLFAVTWEQGAAPDPNDIFGTFVIIRSATYTNSNYSLLRSAAACAPDGTNGCIVMGYNSNFMVSDAVNWQQNPYILYANSEFFTAWDDRRSVATLGWDIWGRSIGVTNPTDLAPDLGSPETILATSTDNEAWPAIAYNPRLDEGLLAYRDHTSIPGTYEYLILGTNPDQDTDGLPDAWEQQIIDDDPGDGINTIDDVNPYDDYDGDLVWNIIEYENGSDPTDPLDYTAPGTGAIKGTVIDGITLTPVEGVDAGATNDETKESDWRTTNANGQYILSNLPPGCYTVQAYTHGASNYLSSHGVHLDLAAGETATVDFMLDSADKYTVRGQVTITGIGGLDGAVVTLINNTHSSFHQTTTSGGGFYQFDFVPPGEIEINIQNLSASTDVEFYGANATLPEIASPPDHIINFVIPVNDACVSGEVHDEIGNPLPGINIGFESELHNDDRQMTTGPVGEFEICGLPPGVGFLSARPSGGNYCETDSTLVFLEENQTKDAGTLTIRSCVLVDGALIANGPDDLCGLEVQVEGNGFSEDHDTVGNTYSIYLPEGTHKIYLESYGEMFEQIVAKPVEITITPGQVSAGTPVVGPDIDVISGTHPQKALVQGSVQKTGGIANPTGNMGIMVFLPGQLDGITMDTLQGMSTTQGIALRDFIIGSPDTINWSGIIPEGAWDVFWILDNRTESEIESITILNSQKDVNASVGTPAVANFVYNSPGSPIVSGFVVDSQSGDPILGANVLITDGSNNLAAFARTNENGFWVVYNLPVGSYTATAGHNTYTGSPTTPITASNGSDFPAALLELTPPAGPGSISGTVMDEVLTPITGVQVGVQVYTGDPCGQYNHITTVNTNLANGTYTITDLDPDVYYLKTDSYNQSNYMDEWWLDPAGSTACENAQSITVNSGDTIADIDFRLDTGAVLTGYVFEADNVTPIANACVTAYADPCWANHYRNTQTNASGYYELIGLPADPDVFLLFNGSCSGTNYITEWYNGQYDCNNAQSIAVTAPVENATLDAGASISGTVQNDTGGTITDQWISVHAHGVTPNSSSLGAYASQTTGIYTIEGLAPGTYKIQANNNWAPGYVSKYFDNKTSMETADEIIVTAGQSLTGIDFTLEEGGTISGNVFIEGSSTPIPNVCVNVYADTCHEGWYQGVQTNSAGYYEIGGLPPGANVYIQADAACGGENYVLQWYGGNHDCNSAQPATVSAIIDFGLEAAGSITGHVEDITGNDIIDLHISAQDYDTGEWFAGSNTDAFGNYTLIGLPSGDYRLQTCSHCSGLPWADEFYDNVYNWESATRVPVTAPTTTPVNDLILEAANTISGTITGLGSGQWININARSDNGTSNYYQDDFDFWIGINGSGSATDSFAINVLPGHTYVVSFSPSDGLYVYFKTGETLGTWDWNQATRIEVNGNVTDIDVTIQADTDWDGMPDDWEDTHFGNLDQDGWGDWDGDGLNDLDEYRRGTLPKNPDTDGDNISDAYEVNWGTDPNQAADAPPIPIIGVVINIHKPNGVIETSVEVLVENGFVGNLPDDIDTITITGPGLSLTKGDLEFLPEWNEWATNIAGSPQLGTYTFSVTSGPSSGTAYDTLTVNRTIPLADHTEFNPPDGATINSPAPTFSWEAVNYPETTLYYRLEIRDLSDVRAYASGRVAGMLSHSVPAGKLNPSQQYKWRVRVGDSETWEGEQNRSNSEWINFTMGATLPKTATPGLDIRDRKSGSLVWTSNSANPSTGLSHEVLVVDYDGIAADGSSHTVTVTYPNGGPTETLNFDSRRDAHSAYYSYWDGDITQPIPSSYNGDYVYSVEDPESNSSQAIDNLVAIAINPPDEKTFTPNFTSQQHIEAYFDNVQVDGSPYDDFEAGVFDADKWNWQPPEVTFVGGEARFERTWHPNSQSIGMNIKNPIGVTGFKANARVENITYDPTKGSVYARLAGKFCMDSRGEVHARVGIRGDEAVYTVYTEFWEGDHLIEIPLISDNILGPVTQGNDYELTLDWNETTKTISFRVLGPHAAGTIDYSRVYTVTDYAGPAPNPYRQLSIVGWVGVNTTTPTFNWAPVPGAIHYRIRIYGFNDNSLYWGEAKSPPYTLPPGIIKPGGLYKYRIYARPDHQWFEWDNAAGNDREKAMFYVDYVEAQDPFIDLNSLGVYIWNHQLPFGETTHFNIRIHDAQGVPGNIESVQVEIPGGQTVNLYMDEYITPTEGKYRGAYFGSIPTGPSVYNFTVTDKDGNVDTETDTFTQSTVDYREGSELLPLHNSLIGGTGVTLDWEPPAGATSYWVGVYDKDNNRILGIHTDEDRLVIPPGILRENELYKYRIDNYGQYLENNLDSASASPPGGLWNAPTFTTTATAGTSNPTISLGDFGVAVWQAPHPKTGSPYFELNLMAFVSDPDGVPQNIARVEVKFPDGTIHQLKYDDSPNWGANYIHYIELADTSSILDQSKPGGGIYEFKVVDREGNEATVQDTLPDVNAATGVIDWVTNVAPVDGTVVTTTTPTISWSTVPGASYYKVRIMSAYDHPTVHWSGEVTGTQYTVPEDILFNGDTHGYRVYAYREPSGSEIDFFSSYSSWHATNNHFTIDLADSDGDGVLDEDDNCPDDDNPLQEDSDSDGADGVGDVCDNCPADSNPDQENFDGDALGDACDPDDDNDNVPDANDNNPLDNFICRDVDADGCDDCSSGIDDPANDGTDTDNDGMCNVGDLDDDNDGLLDSDEVGFYGTNPLSPDTDGDGLDDQVELIWWSDLWNDDIDGDGLINLLDPDSDDDGLSDGDEVNIYSTLPGNSDTDSDGIMDGADNCPRMSNPDQTDSNTNGVGDACDGIVAYYPFSGDTIDDSGNGNDGTAFEAALSEDRFGNADSAYFFDGTNDYISVPSSDSLNVTDALTIAAWVNPSAMDRHLPVVSKYRSEAGGSRAYWLWAKQNIANVGPSFRVVSANDIIGAAYPPDNLAINTWSFIVGTYDGSEVKLYVNGVLAASQLHSGLINTNDLPLGLGASISEGEIEYFYGYIDDIRIFNRALSDSEIQILFSEGIAQDTDGDGDPDVTDPDDDNDNVPDADDNDPLNAFICRDLDADGCDDCTSGVDDPANDGVDTDGDGLCDFGDADADGDGFDSLAAGGTDCNDLDAAINPDATEIIGDGIDQDCDGSDSVVIPPGYYYVDPASGTDDPDHGDAGGGGAWNSLHYALQLINAGAPGTYTLNLAAGSYNSIAGSETDEALSVNQNIEIIGAGQGVTILDGAGAANWKSGLAIFHGAADVRLRDLTIQNFENGIALNSDGGCYFFTNMAVKWCTTGLQIADGYQLRVDLTGTMISENTTGIKLASGSSNNLILYGTVSNNSGDGIRVEGGNDSPDDNRFEGLLVTDNGGNGIIIFDGAGNEVYESTVTGNNISASGYAGIAVLAPCTSLKRNVIDANNCLDVYADDILAGSPLDATYNYWGAAGGPVAGEVSESVLYDPWFNDVPSDDTDNDGVPDAIDNCPAIANALQEDGDQDGIGDVCDPDTVLAPATYYVDITNGSDNAAYGTGSGAAAWKTLHYALDRINAGINGAYTLVVAAGTYSVASEFSDPADIRPLNLYQNITIIGTGVVIDGSGDQSAAATPWLSGLTVSMGAVDVTFQDITIQNFTHAMVINSDGGCINFENVTVTGCEVGLQIVESYQLDIDLGTSVISSCTTGVKLAAGSSDNLIQNGTVSANSGDGIRVEGATQVPSNNVFKGIEISGNGKNGIALYDGTNTQVNDCTITGNNISGQGYGAVAVLTGCTFINWNRIEDNDCAGVYADEASQLEVVGNLIRGNQEGIVLAYTAAVNISSNTITENQKGLVIDNGSSPSVAYNIIWGSEITGMDMDVAGTINQLIYNDIGTTNIPGLPPTNISIDPKFVDALNGDYGLVSTSPCIDATDRVAAGRDLAGEIRPRGNAWDMGAYESSAFADTDSDSMADWWEQQIVDADPNDAIDSVAKVQPNDDYDNDGISNYDEYMAGSDPTTAVSIEITTPANDPQYAGDATTPVAIDGTTNRASGVTVSSNGAAVTGVLFDTDTGDWSVTVPLVAGTNLIMATASEDGGQGVAEALLTVFVDEAPPLVSIIAPTSDGTTTTSEASVALSGVASDDTELAAVSWRCEALVSGAVIAGDAGGSESWSIGAIALEEGDNLITVTAVDSYGKQGVASLIVTLELEEVVEHVDVDLTDQGVPPTADPLDLDGDNYTNDDETLCDGNPDDPGLTPLNSFSSFYPLNENDLNYREDRLKKDDNGNVIGSYLLPDCQNLDDDGDGMPDDWETLYGLDPLDPSDADDNPDGDQYSNLQEYLNNTNPLIAPSTTVALQVLDTDNQPVDHTQWLPEYGKTLKIRVILTGSQWPQELTFTLVDTSKYPGRAVNDPNIAGTATNYPPGYEFFDYDFGLSMTSSGFSYEQALNVADTASGPNADGIYDTFVQCWDYGGRTRLVVTDPGDPETRVELWLPQGSEANGIGSAWTHDSDAIRLDPNTDMDAIIMEVPGSYPAPVGDDFNNFEEYRGIRYTDKDGLQQHLRLNPNRKDLFIRYAGFDDSDDPNAVYPFAYGKAFENAGIDVHDTTAWRHDATEDLSFYTYIRGGQVDRLEASNYGLRENGRVVASGAQWIVTWPIHEWEFKLEADSEGAWTPIAAWNNANGLELDFSYSGGSNSGAYLIRKPLPHINVLVIRHDSISSAANYGEDGFTQFLSVVKPSSMVPLGQRRWTWSPKGYSRTQTTENQGTMYGLTVTVQNAIDHYFDDRPYMKISQWTGSGWTSQIDYALKPLSESEDPNDSGGAYVQDGYHDDNLGILVGNTSNNVWDGDRRLLNKQDWQVPGQSSAFDINNDGLVELPFGSDPNEDLGSKQCAEYDPATGTCTNPYTKAWVTMHTVTHEIGHALGGTKHSKDPYCIMNNTANNYSRADRLSDFYRSLLRIHNKVR